MPLVCSKSCVQSKVAPHFGGPRRGLSLQMINMVRTQDRRACAELLVTAGILERTAHEDAPYRVMQERLAAVWSDFCLCWFPKNKADPPIRCRCWFFCHNARYVHSLTVAKLRGFREEDRPLQNAAQAAECMAAADSADDGNIPEQRRPGKRRRK